MCLGYVNKMTDRGQSAVNCCDAATKSFLFVDHIYRRSRDRPFFRTACAVSRCACINGALAHCGVDDDRNVDGKDLQYTEPLSFHDYLHPSANDDTRPVAPCTIMPCGSNQRFAPFLSACQPDSSPFRRMVYNGGDAYRPASSLPVLDRLPYAQPGMLYEFDSTKEREIAYDGIYGHEHTVLRVPFRFHCPAEQERIWCQSTR